MADGTKDLLSSNYVLVLSLGASQLDTLDLL